ncbi:MAG: rhombosortase, partial [Nitrospinota bacterium]
MVLSGLLVYLIPGLAPLMVYDRTAILSGEVWRLITGHWVHFSFSHLFYDLLAFGLAGWLTEYRGYPYFGLVITLSTLGISGALLIMEPEVTRYGGLSGVATAVLVYLTLEGLLEPPPWRGMCITVLALTVGKILLESITEQPLLASVDRIPFVPIP